MSKKLKQELLAIKAASRDGMLHPARVVAWAQKHPRSALYQSFEWDDGKAASEFRIWQARRLIQLEITTEGGAPQLVSLSIDRSNGGGYRSLVDVARNQSLSAILLRDAIVELRRVQARFARVKELTKVWRAVDKVDAVKKIKKRAA